MENTTDDTHPDDPGTTGLSVARTHTVHHGRPVVAVLLGILGLVMLGGLCFGLYEAARPHTDADVSATVTRGMGLLARAEGGTRGPCTKLSKYVDGPRSDVLPPCQAIIGSDPGAHLVGTEVTDVSLHGRSGTARVRATLVDDSGRHPIDREVRVHERATWRLVWDHQPLR
ncbi:hypothetical protein [Marmoricola sp. RAF53]|uniref:hypothetical protein n=1 Tax=Marmoricola sp. RAF53 TaxID=3233059 RepID=UPI003F9DEDF4